MIGHSAVSLLTIVSMVVFCIWEERKRKRRRIKPRSLLGDGRIRLPLV
jgi:hypothetical protein